MPSFSALCFHYPPSSCTRSRRWSSPPCTFTWPSVISGSCSAARCSGRTSGRASARWVAPTSSRHWRREGLLDKKVGTFTRALHGRGEGEWLGDHQHKERWEKNLRVRAVIHARETAGRFRQGGPRIHQRTKPTNMTNT